MSSRPVRGQTNLQPANATSSNQTPCPEPSDSQSSRAPYLLRVRKTSVAVEAPAEEHTISHDLPWTLRSNGSAPNPKASTQDGSAADPSGHGIDLKSRASSDVKDETAKSHDQHRSREPVSSKRNSSTVVKVETAKAVTVKAETPNSHDLMSTEKTLPSKPQFSVVVYTRRAQSPASNTGGLDEALNRLTLQSKPTAKTSVVLDRQTRTRERLVHMTAPRCACSKLKAQPSNVN